jgi:hypothetical protein
VAGLRAGSSGRISVFFSSTVKSISDFEPIQPPIRWVRGALSPMLKRPGREAKHLPSLGVVVKNAWRHNCTHPYSFMACTETSSTISFISLKAFSSHALIMSIGRLFSVFSDSSFHEARRLVRV